MESWVRSVKRYEFMFSSISSPSNPNRNTSPPVAILDVSVSSSGKVTNAGIRLPKFLVIT